MKDTNANQAAHISAIPHPIPEAFPTFLTQSQRFCQLSTLCDVQGVEGREKQDSSSVTSPSPCNPELWQVREGLLCGHAELAAPATACSPRSSSSSTRRNSKGTKAPCVKLWTSGGFYAMKFGSKRKFWLQCKHSKLLERLKITNWSRFTGLEKIVNTSLTYWEFGFCTSDGDRTWILVKLFRGVRKIRKHLQKQCYRSKVIIKSSYFYASLLCKQIFHMHRNTDRKILINFVHIRIESFWPGKLLDVLITYSLVFMVSWYHSMHKHIILSYIYHKMYKI